MSRLLQWYYLGTPAFYAVDSLFDLNIRVAFLDHWPAGKTAYYILAFVLGLIAWRMPEWTARIGLLESGANVGLLILSVMIWYFGVLDAAAAEFGMPQGIEPQALLNFVLAAVMAAVSWVLQSTANAGGQSAR